MRTSESKDELTAALAYIETHPKEWIQATWICGTSACLGGRAALMSSEVKVLMHHGEMPDVDTGGDIMSLPTWLDLRYGSDANQLWAAGNDLQMLRVGVKAYCNDENVSAAIRHEYLTRL